MSNAQRTVFDALILTLERHGINWAALHGGKELPASWPNDLDLWVDRRLRGDVLDELIARLDEVGHPPYQVFESAVGTTAINCLDAASRSPVQLDLARHAVASAWFPVLTQAELAAAVDRRGKYPAVTGETSLVYVLAKRLEKGIKSAGEVAEIRKITNAIGPNATRSAVGRLLGNKGDGFETVLAEHPAHLGRWLSRRRRRFYLRAVLRNPGRSGRLLVANIWRITRRLRFPAGIVIDATPAPESGTIVAQEFGPYFRGIVPDSWSRPIDAARNRMVIVTRPRPRRPRPHVSIDPRTPAVQVAGAQVERARRGHRRASSAANFPVLCYHAVGLDSHHRQGGKVRWEIEPTRLERDLDTLADRGFTVTSLSAHDPREIAPVALTFDDGNHTDIDVVAPLLASRSMSATFFIPTSRLDQPGYLSRQAVRDLVDAGMEIGSHAHRHVAMTDLSRAEQRDELQRSRDLLEDVIQVPVERFAYPGGRYDQALEQLVGHVGYTNACTIEWRHATAGLEAFRTPRCTIGNGFYRTAADTVARRRPSYYARGAVHAVRRRRGR